MVCRKKFYEKVTLEGTQKDETTWRIQNSPIKFPEEQRKWFWNNIKDSKMNKLKMIKKIWVMGSAKGRWLWNNKKNEQIWRIRKLFQPECVVMHIENVVICFIWLLLKTESYFCWMLWSRGVCECDVYGWVYEEQHFCWFLRG